MVKIHTMRGREIVDSRGCFTLEVETTLEDGTSGTFIVPTGQSTGLYEAHPLLDSDGRLSQAIGHLHQTIFPELQKISVFDQHAVDATLLSLDGTAAKNNLGANTLLGASMSVAKAAASSQKIPFYRYIASLSKKDVQIPTPFINVINGGVHASNPLAFQEFMIVPISPSTFKEKIFMACRVYHALKELLRTSGLSTNVGDEGGFAPSLTSCTQALEFLENAIYKSGYVPGQDVGLALDVSATQLYQDKYYCFENKVLSTEDMIHFYQDLIQKHAIISLEDPLSENDHPGWELLSAALSDKIQLVGDDIFVTNATLLEQGISRRIANSVLVKPNQIGTLTETLETMEVARQANYRQMISHRSGDSEDVTIAHLAVGSGCGQIKSGAVSRSERTAKYNEIIRIEEAETASILL